MDGMVAAENNRFLEETILWRSPFAALLVCAVLPKTHEDKRRKTRPTSRKHEAEPKNNNNNKKRIR